MKKCYVYLLIGLFYLELASAQQPTLVEVDKVKFEELNQTVPIIGSLRSKKVIDIMASVAGKVDQVLVEEGDLVKKGELLAKIDFKNYKYLLDISTSNESKANYSYEIAKVETFNNQLELDRMLALKNTSSFNQARFDKLKNLNSILKTKEAIALSEINVSNRLKNIARLNLDKSQTKALYDGIIEEKLIDKGEFVSRGTKMFQLISVDDLEVIAEVPSFRTFNISKGDQINFSTTDNLNLVGTVRAIGKRENLKTRTVKLFLDFNYESKINRSLIIDENVNILIPISSNKRALTIHKDAILKREGLSLAYVLNKETVEIRPLKLGEAVGNRFIVFDGVKENEFAVIKGNERLRPGQNITLKKSETQ